MANLDPILPGEMPLAIDGTSILPSLFFKSERGLGFYRQSLGIIGVTGKLNLATGILFKGSYSFIHDYSDPTSLGNNTFLGIGAGNFTMSPAGGATYLASNNTGIGYNSLALLTTGYANTAIGMGVLRYLTTGKFNTAGGSGALLNLITGNGNTAFGESALADQVSGDNNTAFGMDALRSVTIGATNTAVGVSALYHVTEGGNNVAVGNSALASIVNTYYNVGIGTGALTANTGWYNTAVGEGALSTTTGSWNVALGATAGKYATGSNEFYLDALDRTNTAGDKAGALFYGTFHATPTSQMLAINAGLIIEPYLPVFADNAAASALASGTRYRTATGELRVKY